MSKYEPLWKFIKDKNLSSISFDDVKIILGFEIDHSFLTYKKELKDFGYEILKISMKNKTILISRI